VYLTSTVCINGQGVTIMTQFERALETVRQLHHKELDTQRKETITVLDEILLESNIQDMTKKLITYVNKLKVVKKDAIRLGGSNLE
jgi:hypothetical protein